MLSHETIEAECKRIAGLLTAFEHRRRTALLLDALDGLLTLRWCYPANADAFAYFMPRLHDLGDALQRLIADSSVTLTRQLATLLERNEVIRERLRLLRTALIEYCRQSNPQKVLLNNGLVEAARVYKVVLPGEGTEAYRRLEWVLRKHQLLDSVTMISAKKLARAINGGRVTPEIVSELRSLCSCFRSYQFKVRYPEEDDAGVRAPGQAYWMQAEGALQFEALADNLEWRLDHPDGKKPKRPRAC
ncbi:MAG: hypothetical protein FJY85_10420 [Deltaproteobacteria bacterium]|nr:hypothetical protein [Deltaproteobacteria bacterium]